MNWPKVVNKLEKRVENQGRLLLHLAKIVDSILAEKEEEAKCNASSAEQDQA